MTNDELKKILDDFDKAFNKKQEDIMDARTKIELERIRQKRIEHDSDYNMGRIAIRLKLKISRENLFLDDITREELK